MNKTLFVFDLDFTLWDAGGTWCDATNPPYHIQQGEVYDSHGAWIRLYPDVREILSKLQGLRIPMALASRTYKPDWANDLLELFEINKYFDLKEIYPDSKIRHFKKIKEHFKYDYNEMVFFDDEFRNIDQVSRLGVECVYVRDGISFDQIEKFVKFPG